jgi:hypothetical protein
VISLKQLKSILEILNIHAIQIRTKKIISNDFLMMATEGNNGGQQFGDHVVSFQQQLSSGLSGRMMGINNLVI